jgi:hypothetical protein
MKVGAISTLARRIEQGRWRGLCFSVSAVSLFAEDRVAEAPILPSPQNAEVGSADLVEDVAVANSPMKAYRACPGSQVRDFSRGECLILFFFGIPRLSQEPMLGVWSAHQV